MRPRNRGCAVVLVGDPGMGRSALHSSVSAIARRRGFLVLDARGSEPESHLSIASLHQLVRDLFPHLDTLSTPQRDALLSAFGMSERGSAEPFLISLAVLELVVDAAHRAPVLITLDDVAPYALDQDNAQGLGAHATQAL